MSCIFGLAGNQVALWKAGVFNIANVRRRCEMTGKRQAANPPRLTRRQLFANGARGAGVVALSGSLAAVLAACGSGGRGNGGTTNSASATFSSGLTAAEIQGATGTVKVLGWQWYQVPEE